MSDIVIGGPYHCRTCGHYHNSAIICYKTPRQNAQIAIDNLEKIIGKIGLTRKDREKIKEYFSDLKKCLDIPVEPLYNTCNVSEEFLNKEKELFKNLRYNPTVKHKNQARETLKKIVFIINEKGQMTDVQELQFLEAIDPKDDPLKIKI